MSHNVDGTLSSSGRVTVPASIRRRLGAKAGDRLRFHLADSGLLMVLPMRGRAVFEPPDALKLPPIGRPTTKNDIEAAIEQEVTTRHGRSVRTRRR